MIVMFLTAIVVALIPFLIAIGAVLVFVSSQKKMVLWKRIIISIVIMCLITPLVWETRISPVAPSLRQLFCAILGAELNSRVQVSPTEAEKKLFKDNNDFNVSVIIYRCLGSKLPR